MNYKKLTQDLLSNPRYKKNIEFGYPRLWHPEGKVKYHILELEANLELLKYRLAEDEYWKLKFIIHVHDSFKVNALKEGLPSMDSNSHASLATKFASELTDDKDILSIIQLHDENFFLWKQYKNTGSYDEFQFEGLLNAIEDWDLFLAFTIIDGFTKGKELAKISWFIDEVKKHKNTRVDASWIPTTFPK